eukprot:CAMPEP_0178900674 /NCGR_PEP_ID=MMETSP0786-20121207/3597_1 /TAXON_ID=186022 /ORGANISM="Thalassionema frauenfeldii, Strain CCMP 1798" /LENGTH=1031 /DNA_ID=CAMNT_0020571689 /DNA_START=8 /DNA_END=3103 /DNA_ORIENTATION=-
MSGLEVDKVVSRIQETEKRALNVLEGLMPGSSDQLEACFVDCKCPPVVEAGPGKMNLKGVADDGLLFMPRNRSSNSEELESSREEDLSDSAANDTCEESSVTKYDLLDEFLVSDDGIMCHDSCLGMLSLPSDSFHHVATFLSAPDWSKFGQTASFAAEICRDVFRRVQMHGFRCATEVVTAWKMNQHADARELSALYIQSGVPIYPYSLGHSYHTLSWRMDAEVKALQKQVSSPESEESNDETENSTPAPIDQFFFDRYSSRQQDRVDIPYATYLEEKCLHHFLKAAETDKRYSTKISMSTRANFDPTTSSQRGPITNSREAGVDGASSPSSAVPLPVCPSEESQKAPKLNLKIHGHLVNQHKMCRPAVNDENGNMVTKQISLDADFFHDVCNLCPRTVPSDPLATSWNSSTFKAANLNSTYANNENQVEAGELSNSFEPTTNSNDDSLLPEMADVRLPASQSTSVVHTDDGLNTDPSILSAFDLFTYYSSEHSKQRSELDIGTTEKNNHLDKRFEMYLIRLKALQLRNDSAEFEEFMLDFWDEFLPTTANIHLFNQKTAVPRVSALQQFLSKPCPKALGVVQCEIQRVKINQQRKGVNMKGRLFPSYEYRLFIRDCRQKDQQQDGSDRNENGSKRRDTILLVGKNKGRKHLDSTGVVLSPSSAKKGVNNYFLTLPDQCDVDTHFRAVNNNVEKAKLTPNGAGVCVALDPDTSSFCLLGRLQSNFIGTEFQIYTPKMHKQVISNVDNLSRTAGVFSSDSESDYSNGFSSFNKDGSMKKGNQVQLRESQRTRIRSGSQLNHDHASEIMDDPQVESPAKLLKSYSLSKFRKSPRNRRRVDTNSAQSTKKTLCKTLLCEEENGAITYTANLLGNRPRIMDVCVPKVSDEGVAGKEWKEHLSAVENCDADSMLTSFKQMQQQRAEDNDQQDRNEAGDENSNDQPDDFGLLSLQNRPPWWNAELGAFVLNFGGRVSVASVKNFQLCDRSADQDHIMLQFGRIQGRHSFTMDFQHPLSAVQAFAIAISSLQSRISFG